jgi:threonine dehydrogenase-like Zn-dependent dehydrogenase
MQEKIKNRLVIFASYVLSKYSYYFYLSIYDTRYSSYHSLSHLNLVVSMKTSTISLLLLVCGTSNALQQPRRQQAVVVGGGPVGVAASLVL